MRNPLSTIRGKMYAAFVTLGFIAVTYGVYTVVNLEMTSGLISRTYKKPLMAINFAHRAHLAFTWMDRDRVLFAYSSDEAARARNRKAFRDHHALFREDMAVAQHRAESDRARGLSRQIGSLVEDWARDAVSVMDGAAPAEIAARLDARRAAIDKRFDLLIEVNAGDGFVLQRDGIDIARRSRFTNVAVLAIALAGGTLVTVLLSRNIVIPLRAAEAIARRIAEGDMNNEIPAAHADETGRLLGSIAAMQTRVRGMMERQVALRESAQRRLIDALEGCPEAVLLTDEDDLIVAANSQIARFLPTIAERFQPGCKAGEAIGHAMRAGLFDPDAGGAYPVLGDGSPSSREPHATAEMKLTDGRWLRISRSRTRDGGSVAFWSEITAIKDRETLLEKARDEAEAANRAKSEFLAHMSHELRTPLNAIIGFADIIAQEMHGPAGTREYRDYAGEILSGGRHLLSVINDLLDMAKSEAGTLKIERSATRVAAIVDACRRLVEQQCRAKPLALAVDVSSGLPDLWADPGRVRQILLNLLSNAIKFTPAGGKVAISCWAEDGCVAIRVEDSGIGMRSEDIPLALAPFGQVDSSFSRVYEGTGLGLPLSRTLVELHGGDMEVASQPGVGTSVTVRLPTVRDTLRQTKRARTLGAA